jgi:hypothetical protein
MTDNFDRALAFVLKWEGGYVNDPDDPGGETRFGISKRAYPTLNIKDLTLDQAKEIYRRDYWQKSGAQNMAWPLCLVVFDTAVNCGVNRAGRMSDVTTGWRDMVMERIEYHNALTEKNPALIKFLRGWIKRCIDLYSTAKEG